MISQARAAAAFHLECGLINAGAAIHQADRGRHPVLRLSGYPPSAGPGVTGGRASFINWYPQVRDQGELVRQYMRWDHKLTPYDNPGPVVTRALQVAQSAPSGPACLIDPNEVAPAIRRALDAMDRQGVPGVPDMWLPKLITGEL